MFDIVAAFVETFPGVIIASVFVGAIVYYIKDSKSAHKEFKMQFKTIDSSMKAIHMCMDKANKRNAENNLAVAKDLTELKVAIASMGSNKK